MNEINKACTDLIGCCHDINSMHQAISEFFELNLVLGVPGGF